MIVGAYIYIILGLCAIAIRASPMPSQSSASPIPGRTSTAATVAVQDIHPKKGNLSKRKISPLLDSKSSLMNNMMKYAEMGNYGVALAGKHFTRRPPDRVFNFRKHTVMLKLILISCAKY